MIAQIPLFLPNVHLARLSMTMAALHPFDSADDARDAPTTGKIEDLSSHRLVDEFWRSHQGISLLELEQTSFQRIRDAVGDCQVVLLGEATHGTEEFATIRSELTTALLTDERGFDAVICGGDCATFWNANRYSQGSTVSSSPHTSSSTIEQSAGNLFQDGSFPQWMWKNDCMAEFIMWLRQFNSGCAVTTTNTDFWSVLDKKFPVLLLGMDIHCMFRSACQVVNSLHTIGESRLAELASISYSTLNSFHADPKYYSKAVYENSVPYQAANVAEVQNILYREAKRMYLHHPENMLDVFGILESSRIVTAAEAYYRQLYFPGYPSTWNVRDSAFLDAVKNTISFMQQHKKFFGDDTSPARVIVWAHNSHVGDASFTGYAKHGQHSLGQLCRQVFGKKNVYIIGFTTYCGTLRAARQDGGHGEVMELRRAMQGSHEHRLHNVSKQMGVDAYGFTLRSNSEIKENIDALSHQWFSEDRLERFVGSSYRIDTEFQSHCSVCNLSQQFDFVLHVDRTTALRVDKVARTSH